MADDQGRRSLFRLPASTRRVSGDVADEIAFHIEERTRQLVERGKSHDEARAQAVHEFGDVGAARTELEAIDRRRVRRSHWGSWWSDLRHDVRYAWRTLLRTPGFTGVAVLTLALGIGATTAIFTVVNGVLLRPLGVAEPEQLVVLRELGRDSDREVPRHAGTVSPANFFDWEEQARSFSSMAYFVQWPLNLTGGGEPQEVQVQLVSADFFSTLGVQPLLGRGFLPSEGEVGAEDGVAVLSHALWRSRYGGDRGILGSTIQVDDNPLTVVGVMGPDFRVLDRRPDLWTAFPLPRGDRTNMGRFLTGIGRLDSGTAITKAQTELDAIAHRLETAYPDFNTGMGVQVTPWRDEVVGDVRPALMMLLGAVGMLLLIASTNVANLLLGRASARRAEIAVRLSLGASRGRLIRQLLTESVLLAAIGGAVGLAAATLGTDALLRWLPESVQLPRLDAVTVDGRVLAFAAGITLLTGVLFGLVPAFAASRVDLQRTLRDESRGSTGARSTVRLRSGLVVAQVGLALMLLIGAGLLLRSFQKLQQVDTGFVSDGVLTLRLSLGSESYDDPSAPTAFLGRMLPALGGLAGVQAVGTVSHLPLTDGKMGHNAWRADRPTPEPGEEPGVDFRTVGGDYFAAQGIRLVAGRTFDSRDHGAAPTTLVINEALARQQFAGENPIGKHLAFPWLGDTTIVAEVIGVVADVHEMTLTAPPSPALYRHFPQSPSRLLNVVIRAAGEPTSLVGAARSELLQIDPQLPMASVRTMEAVVADATARSRLSSYLLAGFAAVALLLAAVGLYGIISYAVVQRRSEIGVRVALGADRRAILRLIVGQGMALTAVGLAIGIAGALALTRVIRSLLFGIAATDLATFVAVPLLLGGVALLASYLPANRAARLDPASSLRAQ